MCIRDRGRTAGPLDGSAVLAGKAAGPEPKRLERTLVLPTCGASSPASIGDCCGSESGPRGQYPQIFLIRPGPAPLSAAPGPPRGIYLTDPCQGCGSHEVCSVQQMATPVLRCWEQAPVLPSLSDPAASSRLPEFKVPGPRTRLHPRGALPASPLDPHSRLRREVGG